MRGITLTELVVAMVIVSIMMVGIFSASNALQSMDKSATTGSALFVRTSGIVSTITRDAMSATGTGTNRGVIIDNASNYFCFRTGTGSTAWACYTKFNTYDLYRCTIGSARACLATDPAYTKVGTMVGDFSLATFNSAGFNMPVRNRENPAVAKSITNPDLTIYVSAYPEGHSF